MRSCANNGFITASGARSKAIGDKVTNAEICAIQELILDAIELSPNGKLSLVITDGTPMTSVSQISGITIVTSGDGYIQNSPVISIDSVAGINFEATAIINPSTGAVTAFNVTNYGEGYEVGDVMTITHSGGITGDVFVGEVGSVSIVESLGDDQPPTAGNNGEVIGITIFEPGTNYFDAPYLHVIDPANTGSGFSADLVLDDNSGIESIIINDYGVNYSVGTAAVIWGNTIGDPALLTVQTATSCSGVDVDAIYYHSAWAKLIDDPVVIAQMDYVVQYFRSKGYGITVKTNPDSMNTIQWQITW